MKLLYQSFLILTACAIVFVRDILPFSNAIYLILGIIAAGLYAFLLFRKKHIPEPLAIFGVITIVVYAKVLSPILGEPWALPATVFLIATTIVLLELTDWFEIAFVYFFSYDFPVHDCGVGFVV